MSVDGPQRSPALQPPPPLSVQEEVKIGAAGKFKLLEAMAQGNDPLQGKSSADAGLPKPTLFTFAPSTMEHLGSLGETQTTADIFNFMELFQRLAQQMRNTARTQRTADMQSQVKALESAAAEMKSAAKSRFIGAVLQGSMQIAGGLMQIGFSSASAKNTIKSARSEAGAKTKMDLSKSEGKEPDMRETLVKESREDMALSKIQGATAQKHQSYSQASGSIASGLGGMVGAGFTLEADLHDARRTELESQSKTFETAVQHSNETMQQMLDVIRDVRDKLQSMQQSALETNRSISRNI